MSSKSDSSKVNPEQGFWGSWIKKKKTRHNCFDSFSVDSDPEAQAIVLTILMFLQAMSLFRENEM